jgi:unsaturated rhamnogalacturonyl hydrolase
MSSNTEITAGLRRLVERTTRPATASQHADHCINFTSWQWHQGVALHGLMKAHAVLNDEQSLEFVRGWVESHLALPARPKSINTTAPLLAIAALAGRDGCERYSRVCNEYADWCLYEAPRLPDGTFEHSCTENRYPQQVWADTLFMGCLFLAKWGLVSGRKELVEQSIFQFLRHYEYLADSATGLIVHGYYGIEKCQKGVLWGRGNGWFAAASAELLSLLPEATPGKSQVRDNLIHQLQGALNAPRFGGVWHTVMNESWTCIEMSATAAFAYALSWAGRQSWGNSEHSRAAAEAYHALLHSINGEGELLGASGGTAVMPLAEDYNAVPYAITCFAQGLAMIALADRAPGAV